MNRRSLVTWARRTRGAGLVISLLVPSCDDGFVKGWLVDRPRVLGARVEVVSSSPSPSTTLLPSRASIAPSERARVTWLIGSPNGVRRRSWAFALCAAPGGNFPEPRCEGPIVASGSGVAAAESAIVPMEMDVPPAVEAAGASELLLLAAFCEAAAPVLDAQKFVATCASAEKPLLATVHIRLASAGANTNPEIATDAVLFDGAPLARAELMRPTRCGEGANVVNTTAGSEHKLTFRLRAEDREPGETLIASHVVTAGTLDRQYSALEADEAAPKEVTVPWTAPPNEEIDFVDSSGKRSASPIDAAEGRLVDLFFVLRDGRGGTAFSHHLICVRRT